MNLLHLCSISMDVFFGYLICLLYSECILKLFNYFVCCVGFMYFDGCFVYTGNVRHACGNTNFFMVIGMYICIHLYSSVEHGRCAKNWQPTRRYAV